MWIKSYGVTIQMKPLQQYFHLAQFICCVAVPFSLWMKSWDDTTQITPLEKNLHNYT